MDKDIVNNVQNILGTDQLPERKVKIEKKEKGLYERTKDSALLLTEDNKILLTD